MFRWGDPFAYNEIKISDGFEHLQSTKADELSPDPCKFTRMSQFDQNSQSLMVAFLDALEKSGNQYLFKRFLIREAVPELPKDFNEMPFPIHMRVFDYSTLSQRYIKLFDAPVMRLNKKEGSFVKICPLHTSISSYLYQVWAFLGYPYILLTLVE